MQEVPRYVLNIHNMVSRECMRHLCCSVNGCEFTTVSVKVLQAEQQISCVICSSVLQVMLK